MDSKRKKRLVQVRQQSKDFAQRIRCDVKLEKEEQLKKILANKQLELNKWKLKTQGDIRRQYTQCSKKFGDAHLNACEASCEENESILSQREQFDLIAAERGRSAMLQEHRKREREAEQRLQQKKRKRQRNAWIQADLISTEDNVATEDTSLHRDDRRKVLGFDNSDIQPQMFVKHIHNIIPRNTKLDLECFPSEKESSDEDDSDEFDQITKMLKQNCFGSCKFDQKCRSQFSGGEKCNFKRIQDNSSSKTISSTYNEPNRTVIGRDKTAMEDKGTEANENLKFSEKDSKCPGEIIPRFSEKTKTGRTYGILRKELDGVLIQENKKKQTAVKALENITKNNLNMLEKARQQKISNAVRNSLKKNILESSIVDLRNKSEANQAELNVGEFSNIVKPSTSVFSQNTEIEVDRLKHLLHQISQYKQNLLKNVIRKGDIPEKDAKNVSIEQNDKKILSPEMKLDGREKRVEKVSSLVSKDLPLQNSPSEVTDSEVPIEIIIKVHPKIGPVKVRKSTRRIENEPRGTASGTDNKKKNSEMAPNREKNSKSSKVARETMYITEDTSSSTAYQSLPEKFSLLPNDYAKESKHKLNSDLMQYITRLLGMNVDIVKGLSASVSTVTTGSCTINTSGNCSPNASAPYFDAERLEKLQEFISDNYSFFGEVNDAIEREKNEKNNANERRNQVGVIWLETLCEKIIRLKSRSRKTISKVRDQELNCTIKDISHPIPAQHSKQQVTLKPTIVQSPTQITSRDMVDVQRQLDTHILKNFAEYTNNCHRKIDGIARMMDQVRREKLKLIENSLSSGDFGQFTECKEILGTAKHNEAYNSVNDTKDFSSQREDPASEEINNILQKQIRPFGVSKDSGISILSRPISSDFRDSPEVCAPLDEAEKSFQPLLKEKVTQIRSCEDEVSTNNKNYLKEPDEKAQKRAQKPPLTLNRFSPHEPHELSTIAEVETPSASKVNLLLNVETIEPFPSFTVYENFQQQKGEHSNAALAECGDAVDTALKTFTGLQDYGIIEDSGKRNEIKGSSHSSSSVVDILKELKRRNLMTEPFKYIENSIIDFRPFLSDLAVNELHQNPIGINSTKRTLDDELDLTNNTFSEIQDINIHDFTQSIKKNLHCSINSDVTESPSNIREHAESSASEKSLLLSSTGQPMNLKEFLSRELTEHYGMNAKKSSNESSLSSQFMRSLINAASSNSSSSDRDKLRTSTPVNRHANNTVSNDTKLVYSSSISTVKLSGSDILE